ncbi:Uu.00g002630.m01.CDS01 [Anthostomella pinea]|uniref:Uu.00g002630.m01.CDS01 n=1 Tax=Anthostomella pinea TaxID=933095 RepID=A0AAI8VJN9_9PEZI|nr:Uu.00g002630.m01.CDS01 [Anthostomella pinea]
MQLFATITSLLIAAAACVSAYPRPPMAKREVGGVLMCKGANATGDCHYEVYSLQDCHDVPDGFSKNTLTFAPDGDQFYCWPRVGTCADICKSPTGCTFGGTLYFSNPAKYDLAKISWDKSLMSFDCHLNSTAA